MRFGILRSPPQVDLPWADDDPLFWNRNASIAVGMLGIKNDLFVNEEFIVQRKIVAVGVQALLVEWRDLNIAAQPPTNLVS